MTEVQATNKIAETAELLSRLSPDNLATVAGLVAMLAGEPTEDAPAPMPGDPRWEQLTFEQKREIFDHQMGIEFSKELGLDDDPEPPAAPTDTAETTDFECVGTISRFVLARLITSDLGAQVFDFDNGFEQLLNSWQDITESIKAALPYCDTVDLAKAARGYTIKS